MKPKISIITPVYNVENYLRETLDSILAQTLTDFQLVLVNDGSKDKSGDICDEYAKKDSRITVIHKENGGVSTARNMGLDNAKGEYIGFVDSDDLISPIMYETLYNAVKENNCDFAQCMHTRQPENLALKGDFQWEKLGKIDCLKRFYRSDYTNSLSLCTKLCKRELFKGIRFPVGKVFEDDAMVPKIIANADFGVFCEENLYCYMKRDNSIITGCNENSIITLTHILDQRIDFFKSLDNELYIDCLKATLHYLKIKTCHHQGEIKNLCLDILKRRKSEFLTIANKYDKIYLRLLFSKTFTNWITNNDFEPIQILAGKLKK